MVGLLDSIAGLGPAELAVAVPFVAVWVAVLGGMVASMCVVVLTQYRSEESGRSARTGTAD